MDLSTHKAALIEYCQTGVCNHRVVCTGESSLALFRCMGETILDGVKSLVQAHYEEITLAGGLEELHESYGEGPYPEDGWSAEDVFAAFERQTAAKSQQLAEDSDADLDGSWMELLDWLNGVFDQADDCIQITMLHRVPEFTKELLAWAGSLYLPVGTWPLDDTAARWLARLAVISQANAAQWQKKDVVQEFHALVREFEDLHGGG